MDHLPRLRVYSVDDDHDPVAMQEILLAGRPTVGVRTGASFVRHGVNGFWVERLPSGGRAVSSPQDAVLFTAYVDRIAEAMKIGRHQIRERAFKDYSTDRIASGIVAKLHDVQGIRNYPSTTTRESGSAGLSLV